MKIDREIRTLICDLDGTLMNPGGGIRVSERVCSGLRRLQELGVMIILASARVFQGVPWPFSSAAAICTIKNHVER